MLEPDCDSEAVTSLRLPAVDRASLHSPSAPPPSVGGSPVGRAAPPTRPTHDFAFADTVFANELADDAAPPPSGPIYVRDDDGAHTQCVTPLAFPLPQASGQVDTATRFRVLFAHVRHGLRQSVEEMQELWAGTAEIIAEDEVGVAPRSSLPLPVRRALALWRCFQWSHTDLTRAAMIGGAVFLIAATVGAVTLDRTDNAGGAEVRAGHTLDQHTGRKIAPRFKR